MYFNALKKVVSGIAAGCLVMLPLVLATIANSADDEEEKKKYADIKTKKSYAVGQKCGKSLEKIPEMVENEAWEEAKKTLEGARGTACETSYELSQVWNYLGFILYSLDRPKDAIAAYTNAINEPEVDPRVRVSTLYTIAQLNFMVEDYAAAAKAMELWMQESTIIGSDAKVILAQAYYQLERKDDSLRLVEEAITETEAKGDVPKEGWWGLQRVIYYEKKDYKKVADILKQLITHYPKYSYWSQLGGMYGEMERDMDRLVSTEVVYLGGGLDKERELLGLAYMFLGAEVPYRAAKILEKGFSEGKIERTAKNLEVLGLAWTQGGDSKKALPILEEAAKKTESGEIFSRLAGVYLDLDQSAKSVTAARNALRKGDLKRPDLVQMNLGSALINLHCYTDAIKAFRAAGKNEKSEKYAKQWIKYAEAEGDRRNKLIESGAKIAGCQL